MSEETVTANPDPKAAASYRAAKAAVIFMSVLLILALFGVVVGFVMRMTGKGPRKDPAPASFTLAPGAKITQMEVSGDRLVLRIHTGTGDEIDIIDTRNGKLVGQIKAPPALQ